MLCLVWLLTLLFGLFAYLVFVCLFCFIGILTLGGWLNLICDFEWVSVLDMVFDCCAGVGWGLCLCWVCGFSLFTCYWFMVNSNDLIYFNFLFFLFNAIIVCFLWFLVFALCCLRLGFCLVGLS